MGFSYPTCIKKPIYYSIRFEKRKQLDQSARRQEAYTLRSISLMQSLEKNLWDEEQGDLKSGDR